MSAASEEARGRWPRITILTPCLNAAPHIAAALDSVARQHYPELEHIVLDGGSRDGTLETLRHYPALTVISEPDDGPHDAMNKGLARASGDIVGFLNADDVYPDGLLLEVGRSFRDDPELAVAVGGSLVLERDRAGRERPVVARAHARESGFWLPELAFGAPGFNARFFRRSLFARIGNFDTGYFIAADRQFLIRVALAGLKARHLERPGVHYLRHPGSRTLNAERRLAPAIALEHIRMARDFAGTKGISSGARRTFRAWRALESGKLILHDMGAGHLGEALARLGGLCLSDPLWPLHLLEASALRATVLKGERLAETPPPAVELPEERQEPAA